jgi:HlyD family secretion protein
VAQARAALSQARVNLAYTDIRSPTSGVVISRNVDVGQTVAASLQAPTIFVIAEDLAKMQVDTSVAEADVGRLKAGMAATFTVDAYPGETFRGKVRQIRNAPQTVQNVVTYDAVIDVDNPELKLKPGMTANVTFVYAEKDDVLKVPNSALRFRPPPALLGDAKGSGAAAKPGASGQRTVWTLAGDKPEPEKVKTGISDGSFTEVMEGNLEVGEVVITDVLGGSGAPNLQNLRRGL